MKESEGMKKKDEAEKKVYKLKLARKYIKSNKIRVTNKISASHYRNGPQANKQSAREKDGGH